MWRPDPMSMRDFPLDLEKIVIETPDGEQVFEARTIGMYSAVPIVQDLELLAIMVADAALNLGTTLDRELRDAERVADTQDFELMLTIRARVKTWPCIPGVTVPQADPRDCPRCGQDNTCRIHATGGNFEHCCSCQARLGQDRKPMSGESS